MINMKVGVAASEQEMSIIEDMDLVYDLKMADKENEIHTKTGLEKAGRALYIQMTPEQKAAWDRHYDPIIKKFKEQKLERVRHWPSGSINNICTIICV